MFNSSIQTVSSAATVMLGTAFLAVSAVAIASPARADTVPNFTQSVEANIAKTMRYPSSIDNRGGVATVAVSLDANGGVTNASLVQSTGVRVLDAEALRTAKAVSYPVTGKPRTIAMVLSFGQHTSRTETKKARAIVEAYRSDSRRLLASETKAQPAG